MSVKNWTQSSQYTRINSMSEHSSRKKVLWLRQKNVDHTQSYTGNESRVLNPTRFDWILSLCIRSYQTRAKSWLTWHQTRTQPNLSDLTQHETKRPSKFRSVSRRHDTTRTGSVSVPRWNIIYIPRRNFVIVEVVVWWCFPTHRNKLSTWRRQMWLCVVMLCESFLKKIPKPYWLAP